LSVADICITRRQGAAVPDWVVTSTPYLAPRLPGTGDAWSAEAASTDRVGTQTLLEVGERLPPFNVADRLDIRYSELAVVRRRLILLDGAPVELADSWYPLSVAAGTRLAENRKIPGGAVTYLAGLGYAARRSIEDVGAPVASADQSEMLGLPPGSRLLELVRTSLAADGSPFEVTLMAMNPEPQGKDLRRIRYELTLD
jgi:DNA-binding GntR family transcriptional regulator